MFAPNFRKEFLDRVMPPHEDLNAAVVALDVRFAPVRAQHGQSPFAHGTWPRKFFLRSYGGQRLSHPGPTGLVT